MVFVSVITVGVTSYCEISERKSEVVDVNKLLAVFKSKEFFVDFHKQNLDKFNQSTELEAPKFPNLTFPR